MLQAGRTKNAGGYRFGFNGMEQTKGVQGNSQGTFYDYKNRDYDPWIIRFKRTDPITAKFPMLSPYQFASNTPIMAIDLDGLEGIFFGTASSWMRIAPLLEDNTVIPEPIQVPQPNTPVPNPSITKMPDVGKISHIEVDGKIGLPPGWVQGATFEQMWNSWRKFGEVSEGMIKALAEFSSKYSRTGRNIPESKTDWKPDGLTIDQANKLIRVGEIKPGTMSGIKRGIGQIGRYIGELQKLYPDYQIISELWTYRVFAIVQNGDNLSKIAENNGTSLNNILKLNPNIKNPDKIQPGQQVVIDEIKFNMPVNVVKCPDCS